VDINQKKLYLPPQPQVLIQDGLLGILFPRQNTNIPCANKRRGLRLLLLKLPLMANNHHHTPHPNQNTPAD